MIFFFFKLVMEDFHELNAGWPFTIYVEFCYSLKLNGMMLADDNICCITVRQYSNIPTNGSYRISLIQRLKSSDLIYQGSKTIHMSKFHSRFPSRFIQNWSRTIRHYLFISGNTYLAQKRNLFLFFHFTISSNMMI
jgi:hypothetical protein